MGANVIEQLLIEGYSVTALCRNAPNEKFLKHPQLQWIRGSFKDTSLMRDAMIGCRFVVHAAAETSQSAPQEIYQQTNVIGTKNILIAAQESAVQRVVLINTANVFKHGTLAEPGMEAGWAIAPFATSQYTQSKLQCLELARDFSSLEIIHIHPTFMIGSWDFKPSSGRIMNMILNKKIAFYPKGGKNFVSVTDVSQAIIQSFYLGSPGQSYLIAGENLSYKQFFKKVIQSNQQKTWLLPIPNVFLNILGTVGTVLKFFGLPTDLSMENMKILQLSNFYTSKKAHRELQIKTNGLEHSITASIRWFRKKAGQEQQ